MPLRLRWVIPMKSEKKTIEEATARLFLSLYNKQFSTSFQIDALGDAPDVVCIDPSSEKVLNLEISLLQDLPGDIPYALGRGSKPTSPTTGSTVVSFFKDSVEQLRASLQKKLLSSYGASTALVLRQVSPLWEPKEWALVADDFRQTVLQGSERNFGAGVWIICTDNSIWPAGDTLFCMSEPN